MCFVARASLGLLLVSFALTTHAAMRDALSATQVFSGLVEARVVRFEMPAGTAAARRKIHSVALSFDGALWLYNPGLGTRLLGPAPADAASLDAAIADRIRDLDSALRDVRVYRHPVLPPRRDCTAELRNGCFAGCLYELAQLLSRGESVVAAGVVFFSAGESTVRADRADLLADVGHSLLVYEAGGRWWALDPAQPTRPFPLEGLRADSALPPSLLTHARQSHYPLARVRLLPISNRALGDLRREARWRAYRESFPVDAELSG